jgi:hypothetical protein
MRDTLIEFMDSLREYVAESGTNIAHDERDSSEFVDIFLNKGQTLPIDSVVSTSVCDEPDEPVERCKCCKSFHEPDVCCYD